ncbi:ABC transporter permease [Nocardiopsis sp. RSe5-2]|uniref:ABC transporter permease n=1 Tax=Nocardiopsis endophytica TaxID=3018445 RepID=A0ABT4TY21_9ACTN|nr:ABC transporter permease [Nocardiopsis endophytica]MDA2809593.1 ABC transporter permease [Nocardiopsis endophytica]
MRRVRTGPLSRLATTALAIALGAMFATATLVFTDGVRQSFADSAMGGADRLDAVAVPAEEDGVLPRDLVARVRELPQVAEADGAVRGSAVLLGPDGRPLGSAAAMAVSVGGPTERLRVEEGRAPAAADEAALSAATARTTGLETGDTVAAVGADGRRRAFTVTGLVDFGLDRSASAAGAIAFDPETAAEVTGVDGYAELRVLGADGTDPEEVAAAVRAELGEAARTMTGAGYGAVLADDAGVQARSVTVGLSLFAAVALFTAALVIGNTYAVLVAQRRRSTALLRCLGADRGQILRGVLAEALAVGLAASAAGAALGVGVAAAAVELAGRSAGTASVFGTSGAEGIPLVVSPLSLALGVGAGVLTTVAAAVRPAVAAMRTAPLAALRQSGADGGSEGGTGRGGRLRALGAASLFALSAAGVWTGLSLEPGPLPMVVVAGAGMAAFAGAMAAAPWLVRVFAAVVRAPLRRLGTAPGLAAEGVLRTPHRTATAMTALAVGAALMSGYAVASASIQSTLTEVMAREMPADYALRPLSSQSGPDAGAPASALPATLARELEDDPAIGRVMRDRRAAADVGGEPTPVVSFFDARLGTDLAMETDEGDLADVAPGRAAVHADDAERLGVGVGDTVRVPGEGADLRLTVAAVTPSDGGMPGLVVAPEDFAEMFPDTPDASLMVVGADGAPAEEVRAAVDAASAAHPGLEVVSGAEQREQYGRLFDTIFAVVVGMLAVAIVIAVLGIANTLALSVLERGREFSLMRALGLTRGQLRGLVAAEAALVGAAGTAVGAVLGVLFGLAAAGAAMDDMVPAVPVARVAVLLLAGIPAGLLASLAPAARAARAPVAGLAAGAPGAV